MRFCDSGRRNSVFSKIIFDHLRTCTCEAVLRNVLAGHFFVSVNPTYSHIGWSNVPLNWTRSPNPYSVLHVLNIPLQLITPVNRIVFWYLLGRVQGFLDIIFQKWPTFVYAKRPIELKIPKAFRKGYFKPLGGCHGLILPPCILPLVELFSLARFNAYVWQGQSWYWLLMINRMRGWIAWSRTSPRTWSLYIPDLAESLYCAKIITRWPWRRVVW